MKIKRFIGLNIEHDYSGCYYEGDSPDTKVTIVGVYKSLEEAYAEQDRLAKEMYALPGSQRRSHPYRYVDEYKEVEFEV